MNIVTFLCCCIVVCFRNEINLGTPHRKRCVLPSTKKCVPTNTSTTITYPSISIIEVSPTAPNSIDNENNTAKEVLNYDWWTRGVPSVKYERQAETRKIDILQKELKKSFRVWVMFLPPFVVLPVSLVAVKTICDLVLNQDDQIMDPPFPFFFQLILPTYE